MIDQSKKKALCRWNGSRSSKWYFEKIAMIDAALCPHKVIQNQRMAIGMNFAEPKKR